MLPIRLMTTQFKTMSKLYPHRGIDINCHTICAIPMAMILEIPMKNLFVNCTTNFNVFWITTFPGLRMLNDIKRSTYRKLSYNLITHALVSF